MDSCHGETIRLSGPFVKEGILLVSIRDSRGNVFQVPVQAALTFRLTIVAEPKRRWKMNSPVRSARLISRRAGKAN
jgi:hypothetical protein